MVSVIIPTYKRAEFIQRAIDSVLNQTYKDVEVIIVDDNNPDSEDRVKLEKIMSRYAEDDRVKYLKHPKNKNGAAARNTGIKACNGKYITFLDDDDFFLRNRIEELVYLLDNDSSYDGAYTSVVTISNKAITDVSFANKEGNLMYDVLIQNSFFKTGSNMFFRATAIKEIGDFDERFLRHQDLEYMVRFFKNFRIKALQSFSVVKDNSSRINFPNVDKALSMRELFLNTFKHEISSFDNPNEIYQKNYNDLLKIVDKKDKNYEIIVNKIRNYDGKIVEESSLKRIVKKIPFIKNLLKKIIGYRKSKILPKEIKKEIKKILYDYKID